MSNQLATLLRNLERQAASCGRLEYFSAPARAALRALSLIRAEPASARPALKHRLFGICEQIYSVRFPSESIARLTLEQLEAYEPAPAQTLSQGEPA